MASIRLIQALAWLPAARSAPTHQGRRRQDSICAEGDVADTLKAEEGRKSLRAVRRLDYFSSLPRRQEKGRLVRAEEWVQGVK